MQAARASLGKWVEPDADHEKERGIAITELGRAVALDPQNAEYFEMLAELINTPPPQAPREVIDQIERDNQGVIQVGAKHSMTATASWWLFLPILLWMGVGPTARRGDRRPSTRSRSCFQVAVGCEQAPKKATGCHGPCP